MDKLKELSVKLNGKIIQQEHYNGNFEETSFKKLIVKDYKQYKIKIDEYNDFYSIGINVNSNLSFSINKPDRIFLYNIPKNISGFPYTVYVSDENSFIQNDNLNGFWDSLAHLLKKIGLSEVENVFFYNNYVFFSLIKQKDLLSGLDDIINFIDVNKNIFKRETKRIISSTGIPENLKPLIPLLKKYAVSDDADREQLIGEMNKNEKLKLINTVRPYFDAIRIYLDSFQGKPLNEEAILIGELAELVSELEIKNL